MDLTGKAVIVTGAGRGIGRAYALALGAAGASVVVNGRDDASVDAVVQAVSKAGGVAVGAVGNVGESATAEQLVTLAVSRFGRLDAMIANAGIARDRVLWKMSDEDFDEVIGVNLRGSFICGRAAAIQMRAQSSGGRIILTSSLAGQRGNFGQTNYVAAKAGIAAMARTWALELARSEITVNAVLPAAATRMTAAIPVFAPFIEGLERGEEIPAAVRRIAAFGTPADTAGLVVFLASDAARHITGQCIGIGGDRLSLWSHPQEIVSAFHEGGWDADQIAEAWDSTVGASPQSFGIEVPSLPPSLTELKALAKAASSPP